MEVSNSETNGMDTYTLTVCNLVLARYYKLHIECSKKITVPLLKLPQIGFTTGYELYFTLVVNDMQQTFDKADDVLTEANKCRDIGDVTILIRKQPLASTSLCTNNKASKRLSIVINRDIQIILKIDDLPLTWGKLMDAIDQKMKSTSMKCSWGLLELDNEAFPDEKNITIEAKLQRLNQNLEVYSAAKLFLKSSDVNQKEIKETTMSTQDALNEIVEGINKLEMSIEKSSQKNDVMLDIPLQDEELFEFYDKVKTEQQLRDLKHSYEKYQQWLTLYGKDENKVERYLIKENDLSNKIINSSIKFNGVIPPISSSPNLNNVINLKIFYLDLNVCFKFTNNQIISLPSGMYLEFDYFVPIETFSRPVTYCLNLVHGIGANTSKTYTRFKHELGNCFRIQTIDNVRIIKKTGENKKVLFTGKRDYFQENKEDKPIRIFNFEGIKRKSEVESLGANDIISTDIDNTSGSALDIDEYDLLTESDSTNI